MSVRYLDQVWRHHRAVKRSELLVLLALADYADDEGWCYPSMQGLADKCRLHIDTARTTVAKLERTGHLQRIVGGGPDFGNGNVNRYRIVGWGVSEGGAIQPPVGMSAHPTAIDPTKPSENRQLEIEVAKPTEEHVYKAYPRHIAKPAALRAIRAALKRVPGNNPKERLDFLMERTKAYAEIMADQDPQFTPYPATWFNQDRFNDKHTAPARIVKPVKAPADYSNNGGFGETRQTEF